MKNAFYLLALVLCCACKGEKKETAQAMIPTPTGIAGLQKSNAIAPQASSTKSNLIFNPPHGEVGHTCALAVGAPLNRTATAQPKQAVVPQPAPAPAVPAANTTEKKLNPKHGEPGHQCDIAVGAPLDSKPMAVAKTTPVQPTVTQVSNIKVGKGLNPPHGQPNHRCDIAVGAPLNSKPAPIVVPPPAVETKTPETKTIEAKSEGK